MPSLMNSPGRDVTFFLASAVCELDVLIDYCQYDMTKPLFPSVCSLTLVSPLHSFARSFHMLSRFKETNSGQI